MDRHTTKTARIPRSGILAFGFLAVLLLAATLANFPALADTGHKGAGRSDGFADTCPKGAGRTAGRHLGEGQPGLGKRTIVMLGDSLTAGGVWDSLDPEALVINQGVTGDGYELVLARLDQAIETRPDLVFLQVGINDLGHVGDLLEIVEGHVEIWSRLREALPGARIVVCSLIPINERKFRKALAGSNQKIRETNKMLAKAAAREGLEFVDLYSPLSGTDQALPSALTFDGLHLTKGGHQIWLDELLSFLRNPSCQPGASPRAASPGLGSGSLE